MKDYRKGFSPIELLVVLALLALLVGLLLPAVQAARGAAARTDCKNRLKQTVLAAHNRMTASGDFPPPVRKGATVDNGSRSKTYTWLLELQPYLEGESVFRMADTALDVAPGWQSPPHSNLATVVKTHVCPADSAAQVARSDGRFTAAYSSYVGVFADRIDDQLRPGLFFGSSPSHGCRPADIRDGLSQTLLAGESPAFGRLLGGAWYTSDLPFDLLWSVFSWRHGLILPVRDRGNGACRGPMRFGPGRGDNPCDSFHFWSQHGGGGHFALADGSVRWFSYTAADLLPALATIAGGEVGVLPD